MAWTAKTLFTKFQKGRNPQPDLIAYIRVDYNQSTGEPINIQTIEVANPKGLGGLPTEPHLLDVKYPSPTGLCSWHIFGAPTIIPERPVLLAESSPHFIEQPQAIGWRQQPWVSSEQAQDESPELQPTQTQPISILTGAPYEPEENGYVLTCPNGCEEGDHFPGCSYAT